VAPLAEAIPLKFMLAPALLVMAAVPALLLVLKLRAALLLLMMAALPAVLVSLKIATKLLLMVALLACWCC
jgi:hypothetical protein